MLRQFDHLVLPVNDLTEASTFYQRLGFTTTPQADHPWGTSNVLVQMQGCFLELLGVTRPELLLPDREGHFNFGAFNQAFLDDGQGLSMLVFRSQDARTDREDFAAKGLANYAPFDFQRQATLPDGREVTVGFSLAFVTHPEMPRAAFFCCQQHAPEHFWRPEFQQHANGAQAFTGVTMVAEAPQDSARFFADLQNSAPQQEIEGALLSGSSRDEIRVVTPQRFLADFGTPAPTGLPCFAAYRVSVADLDATAALLRTAGVKTTARGSSLLIEAEHAFGVVIEFAALAQI